MRATLLATRSSSQSSPPPLPGLCCCCSRSSRNMKRPRGGGRGAEDRVVRISKEMSRVLRHAPPAGAMDEQGWVDVPVLLGVLRSAPTFEELEAVVEQNDKSRFVLDKEAIPPRIRAAQGHSVQLQQPVLAPLVSSDAVAYALHVTSEDGWRSIQASGELRRMGRTHIHFAMAPSHVRRNRWATVYLHLQLQGAMDAGHLFLVSSNGVLLTEGPLPAQYVKQVAVADMPSEWRAQLGGGGGAGAGAGAGGRSSSSSSQAVAQAPRPSSQAAAAAAAAAGEPQQQQQQQQQEEEAAAAAAAADGT